MAGFDITQMLSGGCDLLVFSGTTAEEFQDYWEEASQISEFWPALPYDMPVTLWDGEAGPVTVRRFRVEAGSMLALVQMKLPDEDEEE